MLHGYIIFPLVTAFLYALSTILLKRALQDGAGPSRVTFVTNMVMAVGYQACWLMRAQPFSSAGLTHAIIAGAIFFAGQVFTFMALSRGDVSVATPILGTKVIWVAALAILLAHRSVSAHIWLAVFLTAVGTAILGIQPGSHPSRVAFSITLALATACSFALTDVMVLAYASQSGFGNFIPVMFLTVGVLSLAFLPFLKGLTWSPAWLGPGAALLAIQALGMAYAIATFGHVTTINVVYTSRGIWTIALIWAFGHWFGNTERDRGIPIMLMRLGGAGLLVTAIFIVSS